MLMSNHGDLANDDIRRAAAAALADVDALGAQGEDRKILLRALLEARLGVRASAAVAPPGVAAPVIGMSAANASASRPVAAVADGDALDRLGAVLGLGRDTLELVYAVENDEPHLVISAKRISPNKAQAARQLAQLVAAGRQIAGVEEWTASSTIRKVVADYGRLDVGNFATTLQQLDAVAVSRGKGQTRELKITRPGIEATGDLIKTLVGVDS